LKSILETTSQYTEFVLKPHEKLWNLPTVPTVAIHEKLWYFLEQPTMFLLYTTSISSGIKDFVTIKCPYIDYVDQRQI